MNMLAELKHTAQDHEWYPTTNEIIEAFHNHVHPFEIESLLDIGAGNGKVLTYFKDRNSKQEHCYATDLLAIEKSQPLLESLPPDIGILGTDFWQQSLLDKSVDCIFSNPPYSEFVEWSVKVIREANANLIYLVIPQRWKDQKQITAAIEARKGGFEVIGSFDFLSSEDRQARAKVDLVFIWLCHESQLRGTHQSRSRVGAMTDPFEQWVCEFFKLDDKQKQTGSDHVRDTETQKTRKEQVKNALVAGNGMIEVLDNLYRDELAFLIGNYQKVAELDAALFKELEISIRSITSTLKSRVKGLKSFYWNELFENYAPLTNRLTSASRKSFIESIRRKTNIDFNASNAYAITIWSIKNADQYLDNQMIETYRKMVNAANVINYKSNAKVFKNNYFRYNWDEHSHFKLDYRIVIERMGGIDKRDWTHDARGGLANSSADFIDDLVVVANNLGFTCIDAVLKHNFEAGKKETFLCLDKSGKETELMAVRAYMNGNLHLKLNQKFILALNVEIGRLKGWIHNVQHAAAEMEEKEDEVSRYYRSSYTLIGDNTLTKLLGVTQPCTQ